MKLQSLDNYDYKPYIWKIYITQQYQHMLCYKFIVKMNHWFIKILLLWFFNS